MRRYLTASLALHAVWEVTQLPLYTLWSETIGTQAFAIVHCTIGDVMIAALSLLVALFAIGRADWPASGAPQTWLLLLVLGAGYTVYSEWLNVNVRGSWAYAPAMPTLPILGTGLAPVLQWIVVPTLSLRLAFGAWPWAHPGPRHPEGRHV
jgi:hypothetical protein